SDAATRGADRHSLRLYRSRTFCAYAAESQSDVAGQWLSFLHGRHRPRLHRGNAQRKNDSARSPAFRAVVDRSDAGDFCDDVQAACATRGNLSHWTRCDSAFSWRSPHVSLLHANKSTRTNRMGMVALVRTQ